MDPGWTKSCSYLRDQWLWWCESREQGVGMLYWWTSALTRTGRVRCGLLVLTIFTWVQLVSADKRTGLSTVTCESLHGYYVHTCVGWEYVLSLSLELSPHSWEPSGFGCSSPGRRSPGYQSLLDLSISNIGAQPALHLSSERKWDVLVTLPLEMSVLSGLKIT